MNAGVESPTRPQRTRVPWIRALCTALVLGSAAVPLPSLHFTGGVGGADVTLGTPAAYLAVVPFTKSLDELTLLTDRQHIGLLISTFALLALFAAWSFTRHRSLRRAAVRFGKHTLIMLGVYAVGALAPRPMRPLVPASPDHLLLDVHSHTDESHDGRKWWTTQSLGAWHAGAGFHVTYLTDHQNLRAWDRFSLDSAAGTTSLQLNVRGSRTSFASRALTILPGVETVIPGAHVNLLGFIPRTADLFTHVRNLDTIAFAQIPAAERPLVLLTLPFNIEREHRSSVPIDAVELTDASPKGMRFAGEHRALITALADTLGVPLVAASNNHGWGSTAAAWTTVHMPGWRMLQAVQLNNALLHLMRTDRGKVGVVERAAVGQTFSGVAQLAMAPAFGAHVLRTLTWAERLALLLWLWIPLAWLSVRPPLSAARVRA